jgi:zinc protease
MSVSRWPWLLLAVTASAAAAPPIEHWVTGNGANVYFLASEQIPMVDVRVVFDAGSARDGGSAGLAALTNRLLEDGAGDWNADQIAERFESRGAQFGSGSARDMAWVSLRSLSEKELLQPVADTVAVILRSPRFSAEGFERERSRMITAARERQQEPKDLAEDAFFAAAYPDGPYAAPPDGTQGSLAALTRAQVVDFYRRHYTAHNAAVAIVGALSRAQAERLVSALTRGLPSNGEAVRPLRPAAPLAAPRDIRVAYSSKQTHVLMGQPCLTRLDPEYFPLYVGNHILGGGGLVSRLSREVREKRGLSYSVYSYFMPLAGKGPFLMGLQTKNDQAPEAARLLRENLLQFIREGPTAKELRAAKDDLVRGFPLRIDSNGKLVEYLSVIGFYGLPLDYLDTFTAKVEAVTRDQVVQAFQRRIHPDRLVEVSVGGTGKK